MPVRPLLYAALMIAGAALTAAYAVLGFWNWAVAMAVLALLWLVGLWRSQPFLRGLGGHGVCWQVWWWGQGQVCQCCSCCWQRWAF
jgi:hypothetical protein